MKSCFFKVKTRSLQTGRNLLTNEDNKMQLVQSLLKAWDNDAYAKKLQGRKVVLICEGDAVCYTYDDGIKTKTIFLGVLKSTQ